MQMSQPICTVALFTLPKKLKIDLDSACSLLIRVGSTSRDVILRGDSILEKFSERMLV